MYAAIRRIHIFRIIIIFSIFHACEWIFIGKRMNQLFCVSNDGIKRFSIPGKFYLKVIKQWNWYVYGDN